MSKHSLVSHGHLNRNYTPKTDPEKPDHIKENLKENLVQI